MGPGVRRDDAGGVFPPHPVFRNPAEMPLMVI